MRCRNLLFVRLAQLVLPCCAVLALPVGSASGAAPDKPVIPQARRASLYVSPEGSDSNPGSKEQPLRTIARAVQLVMPGTTVHVGAGTYTGGFMSSASGRPEARIVYKSTERWGARIVPPPDSRSTTAWDNRGSYVDIIGFEVDGSQQHDGNKWHLGIYNGGSYVRIRANHVHHIALGVPCDSKGGSGIGVDGYYYGIKSEVDGNKVHDIGRESCRFTHGIYISTTASVTNNVVYRVSGGGIHLWHDAHHVLITGNTITASGAGIIVGGGDFYHTNGPNDHTRVLNNTVHDNRAGITEQGSTGKHNSYRNNLVCRNGGADWRLSKGMVHSSTIAGRPAASACGPEVDVRSGSIVAGDGQQP